MPDISKNTAKGGPRIALIVLILCMALVGQPAWGQEKLDIDELMERGRRHLEAGELHQAASIVEEVIVSQPDHQAARSMLFTCYRFIGIEHYGQLRCHDAIEAWQKALALQPKNQEIQQFIGRCEEETKSIARISGDSSEAVAEPPHHKEPVIVRVDTVYVPQLIAADTQTDPRGKVMTGESPPPFTFGLSSGIALGTDDSEFPKTGTAFVGSLSIFPTSNQLGARLEGLYSRWYRSSDSANSVARHLTVSGVSLSAILRSTVTRPSGMQLGAGLGIYEIILTVPIDVQSASDTRKSTVVGINLGLAYRMNLGSIAAVVEGRYTHLYSSLTPNLLLLTVGVASN